jgi:hypothetical protein
MCALGGDWVACLDEASSYTAFKYRVIEKNNPDKGYFIKAVRRYSRVCSSGEYKLLLGITTLCDFSHVADSLSKSKTWRTIGTGMDDEFRAALAACIAHSGW